MFNARRAPFEFIEIERGHFQAKRSDVYNAVRKWCGEHYLDWEGIVRVNYLVVHSESIDYWLDQLGVEWRGSGRRPLTVYDPNYGDVVRWYSAICA